MFESLRECCRIGEMYFALIQGISPFQYSAFSRVGVLPDSHFPISVVLLHPTPSDSSSDPRTFPGMWRAGAFLFGKHYSPAARLMGNGKATSQGMMGRPFRAMFVFDCPGPRGDAPGWYAGAPLGLRIRKKSENSHEGLQRRGRAEVGKLQADGELSDVGTRLSEQSCPFIFLVRVAQMALFLNNMA
jgi:hypothetical protein